MVLSFSTPFSAETINDPCYAKVKMPAIDLYVGTTDPKEHLRVYKAQMYIQDVDDATYYHYFLATVKGVRQSSFNGLAPKTISCFQDLADKFISQFIASRKEKEPAHTSRRSTRAAGILG